MKKKRILMITYSPYVIDNRVRREAETLAQDPSYEISCLSLRYGPVPESQFLNGVKVIEVDIKKYRGRSHRRYIFSYTKFFLRAFLWCTRLMSQKKVDVIHVHNMPNFLIFSAIIPRIVGRKIILDMHDNVPEIFAAKFVSYPRALTRLLFDVFCFEERLSCRFAHRIVCANHVQRDVLVARGIDPGKIMVSLNVPDHRTFIPSVPGAVRGSNAGLLLVYHGTLARRLGIDLAIQAVGKLMSRIPGLEYHFFGMGDDKAEFLDVAIDLGLEKQVFFEGFVPFKDLPRVLNKMDLGVISNRESAATDLMLPTKMLEYVALGIPVVAPRLKVIQYYFSDEMVKYFEPGNIESLADAIYELYRDPEKRKKQAELAKEFINKYGWEKSQMDFINFYKGV